MFAIDNLTCYLPILLSLESYKYLLNELQLTIFMKPKSAKPKLTLENIAEFDDLSKSDFYQLMTNRECTYNFGSTQVPG